MTAYVVRMRGVQAVDTAAYAAAVGRGGTVDRSSHRMFGDIVSKNHNVKRYGFWLEPSNRASFPLLSVVAFIVLPIPATTLKNERVHSVVALIMTRMRRGMHSKTLRELVVRHHYLRAAARSGELPKLEGDEDALEIAARFHDEDGADGERAAPLPRKKARRSPAPPAVPPVGVDAAPPVVGAADYPMIDLCSSSSDLSR